MHLCISYKIIQEWATKMISSNHDKTDARKNNISVGLDFMHHFDKLETKIPCIKFLKYLLVFYVPRKQKP